MTIFNLETKQLILVEAKVLSGRGKQSWFLLSGLGPLVFFILKKLILFDFPICSPFVIPDGGSSRNIWYAQCHIRCLRFNWFVWYFIYLYNLCYPGLMRIKYLWNTSFGKRKKELSDDRINFFLLYFTGCSAFCTRDITFILEIFQSWWHFLLQYHRNVTLIKYR